MQTKEPELEVVPFIDVSKPFLQFYWRGQPKSVVMVSIGCPVTIQGHIVPQPDTP